MGYVKLMKPLLIFWMSLLLLETGVVEARSQHQRPQRLPPSYQEAPAEVTEARVASTLPTPEELVFKPYKVAVLPFQNKTRGVLEGGAVTASAEARFLEDLSRAGGIQIFERAKLQSIMKELEHSVSDLFAEDGVTRVGQLSKVDYVVIGSVDNILAKREMSKTEKGVSYHFEGGATVRLRIVEVASGKVLFTGQEEESHSESSEDPRGADLNHLVETSASDAAGKFRDDIQSLFPLRGYVINISEDGSAVLINLGAEQGIAKNRIFEFVVDKQISNQITGKTNSMAISVGEGKVREVLPQESWLYIAKKGLRDKIQIGWKVRSTPQKRGFFTDWK